MLKALTIASAGAAILLLGACAQSAGTATGAAPAAYAGGAISLVTARGAFVGKSDHVTVGHASIGRSDGQWVVVLEDDFSFDGAPDPRVALGNDGYVKEATLGLLSSNDGRQVYAIPDTLDVADFNEIWIWCDQFSVPLGVASLELL